MNAAVKSLQSCPTLCDPIDGSPPGSPIPGILQARTLEWGAISEYKVVIVASPSASFKSFREKAGLGAEPPVKFVKLFYPQNEKNRRPKAARKGSRRWDVSTDCRVLSQKVKSSGRESPRPRTSQQNGVQILAMPFSDCVAAMN